MSYKNLDTNHCYFLPETRPDGRSDGDAVRRGLFTERFIQIQIDKG